MTRASELRKILTWEYFHEEEREREWTDSEFSGLDWMAMAWSLHLSQQSKRKKEGSGQGKAKSQNLSGPAVSEEFVLKALCKLLDAAPPYQLIPIIPKLCEFVQWFDDTELPEYRLMISTLTEEAVRVMATFTAGQNTATSRFTCFTRAPVGVDDSSTNWLGSSVVERPS